MATDYLRRIFEEINATLKGVIAKQHGGQYAEARTELDQRCEEITGLKIDKILKMSPEVVQKLLDSSGAGADVRGIFLAELLLRDAIAADMLNDSQRASIESLHAFCLLATYIGSLDSEEQSLCRSKLDSLANRLREIRDNPYITDKLCHHGYAVV